MDQEIWLTALEEELELLREENGRYKQALSEIKHGTSDTWAETRARDALLGA
jgi:hypothetical protein